jgi:hypothetical protein
MFATPNHHQEFKIDEIQVEEDVDLGYGIKNPMLPNQVL